MLEQKCVHCGASMRMKVGTSFLGFKTFTCPLCGNQNKHILHNGYRAVYAILAVLGASMVAFRLAQDEVPRAGILFVIALVVLGTDFSYRRKVG